jgi:hypothetical protein
MLNFVYERKKMKNKLICCILAALAVFGLSSCTKTENDTTNGQPPDASQSQKQDGSKSQSQSQNWFSDAQLSMYGATGVIPPAGYNVESLADARARYSNVTEDSYRQYVYDSYNTLNANNRQLYTLAPGENVFRSANLPNKSVVISSPNTYYYRVGDKIYSVFFGYTAGTTPSLSIVETQFNDVTEQYRNYRFE